MNQAAKGHRPDSDAERSLAESFRKAGWTVTRLPRSSSRAPDLVVRRGTRGYAVILKWASEGRRDRVVPLLAEAILRARGAARDEPPLEPLAVVGSERVAPRLAGEMHEFAAEFAPDVAIGVLDREGRRSFAGIGLEELNASPKRRSHDVVAAAAPTPDMFSDLNQWMLKVLLAPAIPEELLAAPRGEYGNASELARAAGVSIMSAFRLVDRLRVGGFLDTASGHLRLVRLEDLLRRWQAMSNRAPREWAFRFTLRADRDRSLEQVIELVRSASGRAIPGRRVRPTGPRPQMCLGLFSAAELLGFGHVSGVSPHVYVADIRGVSLQGMGLIHVSAGQNADVFLRVPFARQAVFRGAVQRGEVLVADALQVWLDVSGHSFRGQAQALEIERRLLKPLFGVRR